MAMISSSGRPRLRLRARRRGRRALALGAGFVGAGLVSVRSVTAAFVTAAIVTAAAPGAVFVAAFGAPAGAFAADRPTGDARDDTRDGAPDGAPVSTGAVVDSAAGATAAELFREADLVAGAALIAEHDCDACHRRNVGGDGLSIYRPTGRISTPGFLRGMVEYCNTQLNLQLFPEDVTSIAATLNRDHYRFK